MVTLETLELAPALTVAAPLVLAYGTTAVRYAMVDSQQRAVMRKAWAIRSTWRRTAARVGLIQTDHAAKVGADIPLPAELRRSGDTPKVLVPKIRVHVERWGLRIEVETLGRLGLGEFQAAADYLADAWRVPLVRIERSKPGFIRIRALLRDPLTVPIDYSPAGAVDLDSWHVGHDQDGQPVTVRCSGVSGVVVAGLSGYGKTSLINTRISQLAVSGAVQFVMIDGKGGPDYDDLLARAWLGCRRRPDRGARPAREGAPADAAAPDRHQDRARHQEHVVRGPVRGMAARGRDRG